MVVVPTVITTCVPAGTTLNGIVRTALCVLLILAVLARVVRSNNSRASAEQATRRRATHDALTDLPNRELLAETITALGRPGRPPTSQEISLLFIDLDRFKMVNDHWGHQVGDELLCAVAGRLSAQIRGRGPGLPDRRRRVRDRAGQPVALRAGRVAGRPGARTSSPRPFELSVGDVVDLRVDRGGEVARRGRRRSS